MELTRWNDLLRELPSAHILQTRQWAEVKAHFGWTPLPKVWRDEAGNIRAAALVLERSLRLGGFSTGLRVMYIPRGPLLDWEDEDWRTRVINDLEQMARQRRAIFLKMDPEVMIGKGIPQTEDSVDEPLGERVVTWLVRRKWRFSSDQIQFRNTVWLDLSGSEEDWLARMKQKTRYNLRLAQRKGVTVRLAGVEDLPLLYRMYAETSLRDGFAIRNEAYYQTVWRKFLDAGMAEVLLAEVEGEVVAGLVLFFFADRAWYLYGMSRDLHREKMPNYPLQWEAMRRAKAHGCRIYDLWGAPDEFNEQDRMWGVFRFKQGLGGEVIRTIGAWDYPARPWLYGLYLQVLPRLLHWMRRRGQEQTRQEVGL
ncbi:MAG: peptidoglycan bridge formation glycyltransferase FemA/FemB family protein [Chloroflexota bacterium]|nr:MAG: methicillin resistance protein [Bellilinea sp.]